MQPVASIVHSTVPYRGVDFAKSDLRSALPPSTLPPLSTRFLMFAVVSIAGFQEMVKEGDTLEIPLQDSEKDKTIEFKDVLMVMKDGGDVILGKPFVDGASVSVKVIEHGRDAKIRVLKFRKRKRYLRTKGHRQDFTKVEVTGIKA